MIVSWTQTRTVLTVNKTSVRLKLRVESSLRNGVLALFIVGQCNKQHLKHTHRIFVY